MLILSASKVITNKQERDTGDKQHLHAPIWMLEHSCVELGQEGNSSTAEGWVVWNAQCPPGPMDHGTPGICILSASKQWYGSHMYQQPFDILPNLKFIITPPSMRGDDKLFLHLEKNVTVPSKAELHNSPPHPPPLIQEHFESSPSHNHKHYHFYFSMLYFN